jgi:2-amino-4-hydroxy-6-hydroxymethyldihydropteridine diphosphokinase
MAQCLIALGSNLGDREPNLRAAWEHVGRLPETTAVRISRFLRTEPAGGPQQGDFLNACGIIATSLPPEELLARLQEAENQLGRVRHERWGPRAIDLDLLLYDGLRIDSARLTLPHPRMSFRRFVLEPAVEIAPDWVHPTSGWTLARLLGHLNSAAKCVALVSSDESLLQTLVPAGNRILAGSDVDTDAPSDGWTLAGYRSLDEIAAASTPPKLIVSITPPDEPSPALSIAGPSLQLVTRSSQAILAEVLAAVQAMQ